VSVAWPFLAIAGLGAFHGINPAMGWLFAVALGLHRGSRAVVVFSLVPIALGHLLAIAAVALSLVLLGPLLDGTLLRRLAGIVLLAWAAFLVFRGSRHRVRVGMTTGAAGLALWSFLMANAHGAGAMLAPALIPLCIAGMPAGGPGLAVAAVLLHTATMLAVMGVVAVVVHQWVGVAILRRGWINFDRLWLACLGATGALLLI
jgi:hypothetical protein